jgi:release factor glutamine methyltransferase
VTTDLTLRAALADAAQQLADHGVPSPGNDAEELAAHLLDTTRAELWRHLAEPAPVGLADLVRRRAARVPLQHITGRAHFRHLSVLVGPGVFVPRPETEVVVQHALDRVATSPRPNPVVVDLCSGSGVIAASIAAEAPGAVVHAVEADQGALPWLRRNLADTGVQIHGCDLDDALPGVVGGVDIVVANPPYIPEAAVPRDPEVARHDPAMALYSGPDGLDHIRRIETLAARLLRAGGWVVVEHADEQGTSAPAVFAASTSWVEVSDHLDLTGRPRVVVARRAERTP